MVADRVMVRLGRPRGEVQTPSCLCPADSPLGTTYRELSAQGLRHGLETAELQQLVDRFGHAPPVT